MLILYERIVALQPEDLNIKILQFQPSYLEQVQKLIFHIQNDEFTVGITLEAQPDLIDINTSYIQAGGNFFIASYQDQVI